MKKLLLILLCLPMIGFAQCPAGQTEVFIDVLTDGYGKEIYWELAPTSSNCGSSVIHF